MEMKKWRNLKSRHFDLTPEEKSSALLSFLFFFLVARGLYVDHALTKNTR
jgi:hypothetical protein